MHFSSHFHPSILLYVLDPGYPSPHSDLAKRWTTKKQSLDFRLG